MQMPLSDTQRALLAFLHQCIEQDGVPPSQLEICAAFGFQRNSTANYHLRALEEAGQITRVPGQARSIRLLARRRRSRPDQLRLPVLGRVAAGLPVGADIGSEAHLVLDRACFDAMPDYLLTVAGDSMRDDGIFDGDLVAVKRAVEARNGQIVVARLDDAIAIKRLKLIPQGILLMSRHPDFAPIVVPPDADFAIEGIYCGLVRRG